MRSDRTSADRLGRSLLLRSITCNISGQLSISPESRYPESCRNSHGWRDGCIGKGIPLPLTCRHSGSHPSYSARVIYSARRGRILERSCTVEELPQTLSNPLQQSKNALKCDHVLRCKTPLRCNLVVTTQASYFKTSNSDLPSMIVYF